MEDSMSGKFVSSSSPSSMTKFTTLNLIRKISFKSSLLEKIPKVSVLNQAK